MGALVSCNSQNFVESKVFCFDSVVDFKLYNATNEDKKAVEDILKYYDKISDNYNPKSGVVNLTNINTTNEEIEISEKLYKMLKSSFEVSKFGADYFNPLCGSLVKKWKDSLNEGKVLSEEVINSELDKINNSELIFLDNNKVQRIGEAELDLGGIAKGYVLDEIYTYLKEKNITNYLVDAGSSSILVGEKSSGDGYYSVGIKNTIIQNKYFKVKNAFVSTSALNEQGVLIGDKMYSHIVNPKTGSAINLQEAVIVISDKGYIGDALSTSMMMNTLEEIKAIEAAQNIKCIVINNNSITYHHPSIEVNDR